MLTYINEVLFTHCALINVTFFHMDIKYLNSKFYQYFFLNPTIAAQRDGVYFSPQLSHQEYFYHLFI